MEKIIDIYYIEADVPDCWIVVLHTDTRYIEIDYTDVFTYENYDLSRFEKIKQDDWIGNVDVETLECSIISRQGQLFSLSISLDRSYYILIGWETNLKDGPHLLQNIYFLDENEYEKAMIDYVFVETVKME